MAEPSAEDILRARDSDATPEPEEKVERTSVEPDGDDDEPEVIRQSRRTVSDDDADDDEGATVPRGALEAEREKRRKYTDEVADTRRVLADVQRQNAEMAQALLRLQQQPQQPQPQQPQPPQQPEFDWDNPIGTVDQRLEARILQERQLWAAKQQADREKFESRLAVKEYGRETVQEAFQALADARATDPYWGSTYQYIMGAPDQYEAMVAWHKERKALSEVGNDPQAYKARIRAEYLEELRNGNGQTNGRDLNDDEPLPVRRPRMPSDLSTARSVGSRSGPAFSEPSIKDILANR